MSQPQPDYTPIEPAHPKRPQPPTPQQLQQLGEQLQHQENWLRQQQPMPAHMLPPSPQRGRNPIDAFHVSDLSSQAAALGLTNAQMNDLLRAVQTAAMDSTLHVLPEALKSLGKASQARILGVLQQLQALRRTVLVSSPPPGFLDRITGRSNNSYIPAQQEEYVRWVDVEKILERALLERAL